MASSNGVDMVLEKAPAVLVGCKGGLLRFELEVPGRGGSFTRRDVHLWRKECRFNGTGMLDDLIVKAFGTPFILRGVGVKEGKIVAQSAVPYSSN